MKSNLLILFALVGLSLLIPQVWGVDLKRADDLRDFDKSFSIYEKQVRYHIPYKITNGIIHDMQLNCDTASLVLSVMSESSGTINLDIPQRLFGGIFMVLVDGEEWDNLSITQNILTVNFPQSTSSVEIRGSYYITPYYLDSHLYTGVCDVVHDPPYSYILSPLKQIKNGVEPWMVKCNGDLTLLLKPAEFTESVCVTGDTHKELSHRGWGVIASDDYQDW
ncbi:MAG: hypothetical protein OEW49_04155 [Nitrosopumilus sp.]|nr:hypothetical protein [Nitrosopumilus sp.]